MKQRDTERDREKLQEARQEQPKETERYHEEETERHGKRLSGGQRSRGDTRQRQKERETESKVENETYERGVQDKETEPREGRQGQAGVRAEIRRLTSGARLGEQQGGKGRWGRQNRGRGREGGGSSGSLRTSPVPGTVGLGRGEEGKGWLRGKGPWARGRSELGLGRARSSCPLPAGARRCNEEKGAASGAQTGRGFWGRREKEDTGARCAVSAQ